MSFASIVPCVPAMVLASALVAQEPAPVENLGAAFVRLEGNLLFYSTQEAVADRDLNGDGDAEDFVAQVRDLAADTTVNLSLAAEHGGRFGDLILLVAQEPSQGADLNGDGDLADGVIHLYDLAARRITNLRLAANPIGLAGDRLALGVDEIQEGRDLNGVGDALDRQVIHVFDLTAGRTSNLGLAADFIPQVVGDWLLIPVAEATRGADLNGDGDLGDVVPQVHRLSSGATRNLAVATMPRIAELFPPIAGDQLVLSVREADQGADLDGDGDLLDDVTQVHDLVTGQTRNLGVPGGPLWLDARRLVFWVREAEIDRDLNGDADLLDGTVHVHDFASGKTTNLALEAGFSAMRGDRLVLSLFEAVEARDLNGDGDTSDTAIRVLNLAIGESRDLGLAVRELYPYGEHLLLAVLESQQGADLNSDGDRGDKVLAVHELASGQTSPLGLAGSVERPVFGHAVFRVSEPEQGADLNGDGDTADEVVHTYELATRQTRNTGLAGFVWTAIDDELVIHVSEAQQGRSLNADGDLLDRVPHVYDLTTGESRNLGLDASLEARAGDWEILRVEESAEGADLNRDGDMLDHVVYALNSRSGAAHNLGLAGAGDDAEIFGDFLAIDVSESEQGQDLNRDGDAEDHVIHLVDLSALELPRAFVRGDCNGDGVPSDVADAVTVLLRAFVGGIETPCRAACDANGDGALAGIPDAIALLSASFLGTFTIPPPHPGCGDLSAPPDIALGCERPPAACR